MGKLKNYKRSNKELKGKLQDLFINDACLLEDALEAMQFALTAFCAFDMERKKRYSNKCIDLEDEQDQCRDEIISRIFGSESMVFSRPDRMRMVTAMDRIVGQAKKVMFDLEVFTPENPIRELNVHIEAVGKKTAQIGKMVNGLVSQFFDNFDEAMETCVTINEARHSVRERKLEFFKALYYIKPDYREFRFYAELMNNLAEVTNRMEHFADYIYGLIAKYSTF
ncbi:hypothetical protein NEF87_002961 [Candidatus Lokiarchaeum ossiferum]|uniref:DUF47 family protein n=1 Tax=Candidatus Lokiarchaeum ossiferum TaxID=2951803 RepID=A0ABY6HT31_9ARCH|nr:hypothetical protein NEF87_002961 [Candidatus Lokiarchaeum sp. B-35]